MEVKFNKDIYSLKAIKGAIREFKHLAGFSLEKAPNYIIVTIKNIDKDVKDVIKDELGNYVLYLMNK